MVKILCATTVQARKHKLKIEEGDVIADCSGGCGADCIVSESTHEKLKDTKVAVYCDKCLKAGKPVTMLHVFH